MFMFLSNPFSKHGEANNFRDHPTMESGQFEARTNICTTLEGSWWLLSSRISLCSRFPTFWNPGGVKSGELSSNRWHYSGVSDAQQRYLEGQSQVWGISTTNINLLENVIIWNHFDPWNLEKLQGICQLRIGLILLEEYHLTSVSILETTKLQYWARSKISKLWNWNSDKLQKVQYQRIMLLLLADKGCYVLSFLGASGLQVSRIWKSIKISRTVTPWFWDVCETFFNGEHC